MLLGLNVLVGVFSISNVFALIGPISLLNTVIRIENNKLVAVIRVWF